jgi:hypothetical protein
MFKNFKPIKQRYQLLILVLSLIISHYVLDKILFFNATTGVYPPESDTIIIPFVANLASAFSIFILSLIAILIPKTKLLGIVSVIALGLASLLTFLSAFEWFYPQHYPIGIAFIFQLLVCIYMLLSAIQLRTLKMKENTIN